MRTSVAAVVSGWLGIINYNKIAIFHKMNPDDIVFCYNKDAQNEKSQQKLKRTIATGIAQ